MANFMFLPFRAAGLSRGGELIRRQQREERVLSWGSSPPSDLRHSRLPETKDFCDACICADTV